MPLYGFQWGVENLNGRYTVKGKQKQPGGYGASLKEDYRFFYGAHVGMAGRGEAIAREDSYCGIDPKVVDKFGIPVLRFHWQWSDNETKMARDMQQSVSSTSAKGTANSSDKATSKKSTKNTAATQ